LSISFKYLILLVNVIVLNSVLIGQDKSKWELVKSSNDIKVYTQKVADQQIKKVKIESVVTTTLSELVVLFKDAKNHSNWVFLNESAKIVEVIDNNNWKYYSYTDSPWPVANRDYYTNIVLLQNDIDYSVIITSTAIPDFAPKQKDCIRISYIKSVWNLNPIGNGSIHITFELEVDPGGNIPPWLVNMAITKGPYNTMVGLIKELKTKRYNNIELDYIEELEY
jgi:hypothetical protein